MSAAESAQELRRANKPGEAREKLALCSDPSCPGFVRTDCKKWMQQVLGMIAPVTLRVADEQGRPVAGVRVYVDGVQVADRAAAADEPIELELDPGTHALRFEHAGSLPVTRSVEALSGQRVDVAVQLATPKVAPAPVLAAPLPQRVAPYKWIGIVGVVSAAVGIPFQIIGMQELGSLDRCKPDCTTSSRDSARTALWVGNVGLGLGVAALATAVVLYAVRPEAARASGPVRLSASSGGLGVAW